MEGTDGQRRTGTINVQHPVIRTGLKMRATAMKFATALAALAWCQDGRVGMVYTPATDPARN